MAQAERSRRSGREAVRGRCALQNFPCCGPAWRLVARSCLRTVRPFHPTAAWGRSRYTRAQELGKDVAAIRNKDDADAARAVVESLLKRPLTADAAVQIALLNNRDLQAAYNELAVAEADLVQASLPPNPTLLADRGYRGSAGVRDRAPDRRQYSWRSRRLPARADIAADRFRQAQLRAIGETLRIAIETRRAFYRAVAARETGRLPRAGAGRGRIGDASLPGASAKVRRDEQARSGARSGVLRRVRRRSSAPRASAPQASASD